MHPPLMRTALNIGALYGISSFVVFLMLHYTGSNPLSSSSLIGFWVPLLFIIGSIRYFRDKVNTGFINYWQAFQIGFLTIACGAFLYSLLIYLFGLIGAPDLVDNYKEQMLNELGDTESAIKGIFGDKLIDMLADNINKTSLTSLASSEFFNKCIGSFFMSLIVAAIMKRNQPSDQIA